MAFWMPCALPEMSGDLQAPEMSVKRALSATSVAHPDILASKRCG